MVIYYFGYVSGFELNYSSSLNHFIVLLSFLLDFVSLVCSTMLCCYYFMYAFVCVSFFVCRANWCYFVLCLLK